MSKIIDSLKNSDVPHLYLLNIGLTREEYNDTSKMSRDEKLKLVNNIIMKASHEEILKIINDFMALELSIESNDPIRTGNRLIGQLLLAYITKIDQQKFITFYDKEIKNGNKTLGDYIIPEQVKQIWAVIKNAAAKYFTENLRDDDYQAFLNKGFKIIPIFYYQQQFPEVTPEQFIRGVRPIELTRERDEIKDAFHRNLAADVTIPEFSANNDLKTRLHEIKTHILTTEWKVGNYLLFKGGVMHGDKRLPHRVNDILDLIEKVENGKLEPKVAYAQIVEKAKEALDNPRNGRFSETTDFYQDIYNHHILSDDYDFNHTVQLTTDHAHLL
ncbi:TPA: hypothetical protein JAN72_12225 [Legionella pneumophila]|uniref:Uncharacterized protein n=1 Tax=Legionella pneumophila TaxID=446 RepID=A0AAN5KS81_LEGPN|nr:hypothetical protein [Legionella pneumophila]HAT1972502.1 hypothetical protein [Legionella pneumophila]HAT6957519.1 hypothetical protein [Legionella pneumophila]HEN4770325.1 hypothetical protein [Legionella pneumophila]